MVFFQMKIPFIYGISLGNLLDIKYSFYETDISNKCFNKAQLKYISAYSAHFMRDSISLWCLRMMQCLFYLITYYSVQRRLFYERDPCGRVKLRMCSFYVRVAITTSHVYTTGKKPWSVWWTSRFVQQKN